ncbi:LCP family protein, partial [Klenkia sp. PcliD-1-E]|uniref:LCP family protein n=1 Tax=Klenkia sp. PcliD-1-E TaxID=2954492 RepID=UPI0027E186D9
LPGTGSTRPSAPVPPLPGLRTAAPLPPIPGLTVPVPGPVPRTRAEKWAALGPRQRRLVRVAVAVAALVVLVGGFYAGLYVYADRSVDRVAALAPTAPEVLAPQLQAGATTWLVLGTGAPGEAGPAAVSASLVRVAGDGGRATVLDLPSTALVDTPECRAADGEVRQPTTEPLVQALAQGGPSCLVRAVQQLSGLRVDHYLDVDLGRAGDGVPSSCPTDALPEASATTLLNPLRAVSLATGAADVATTDEDTSLAELRTLAGTLRSLPAEAVERTELPVARVGYLPAGSTTAAVVLDGTATRDLFDSVIRTGELPPPAPEEAAATPASGTDASVTLPPSSVTLSVLDATGDTADPATGAGAQTMAALAAQGFVPGPMGIEPAAVPTSLVRYAPDALEAARTVAAAVPGAALEPTTTPGTGVQLVVASPDLAVAPVAVGAAVPETPLPAQPPTATCG